MKPLVEMSNAELLTYARKFGGTGLDAPFAEIGRRLSAVAPTGWKIVPVEPTNKMVRAVRTTVGIGTLAKFYKIMIYAAPTPPTLDP